METSGGPVSYILLARDCASAPDHTHCQTLAINLLYNVKLRLGGERATRHGHVDAFSFDGSRPGLVITELVSGDSLVGRRHTLTQ